MSAKQKEAVLRVVPLPRDTNQYGIIFGGYIMSLMDQAAGIAAIKYAKGPAVTKRVEAITFDIPVYVGDTIIMYANVAKTGNTSMTIEVVVEVERAPSLEVIEKVTTGLFVFVAIDPQTRRPRQLTENRE